ncbi:MAG: hypothetical protein HY298_17010 [Verrucomicrobia bacterium]|nr:hypothetical protein [Verrucomicrobiota bacterium]
MCYSAKQSSPRIHLMGVGVALGCLAAATVLAQRGQPIEFSAPQDVTVSSNLNQLRPQPANLRQLEEETSKPFESLNPDSSLGPVITTPFRPPPRPAVRSKRAKDREELLKNWVFMNPDDLTKGPTPEEIFKVKEYEKNGQEKKPLSAFERYNQNPDRTQGGDKKKDKGDSVADKEKDKFNSSRSHDRPETLQGDLNNPEKLSQGFLPSDLSDKTEIPSTTLTGTPFPSLLKDSFQTSRDTAREARMEEFKQLLEPHTVSSPILGSLDPLNQQVDAARALPNPARSLEGLTAPTQQDPFNPIQSGFNPSTVFQPGLLQDFSARPFGQSSLTPALQPSPTPKVQPPQPNFTFPTRKF